MEYKIMYKQRLYESHLLKHVGRVKQICVFEHDKF